MTDLPRAHQQRHQADVLPEETFRLAVEAAPNAMIMVDREGTIRLVNTQAERLFDYPRAALLGQPIELLLPERFRAGHPQERDAFFATPTSRPMGAGRDLFGRRQDGTEVSIEIGLNPLETAEGTFVLASIIDITERQRAEAALRSSEIRKTAVLDAALDCIITIDSAGKVVEWNPAAETTFGFSREQVLGHPLAELIIPPDFRAAHSRGLAQYLATGAGAVLGKRVEFTALRADGTRFPAEISIVSIPLPDALLFTGYLRDITERKQVEDRFRLVVEAAPSALLMVNEHGVMTLVNSQTEQLFGYSRAELLGQPVEMLVPERFWALHPRHREGFFQTPTTRAMGAGRDLFGLCKDGREVPIEIGLNPLRTEEGPLVLASIIDITERVQAAQRLMNSLREKEVLLREIHHRVKNNLAVIGSLLYLQSSTTQDEQTLRMLQNCRDRVHSMALVHERLYRSEDLASVDFAEYTEELTSQLFRNHVLSTDTIRLKLEVEKIPLDIDRAIPCGLILNELISNALKHAFPNGRSGEIRVSLQRTQNGGLILSVADNGVGLPDEATLQTRRSLGLRLVHSLATQLDTQIEFLHRDPGTGRATADGRSRGRRRRRSTNRRRAGA